MVVEKIYFFIGSTLSIILGLFKLKEYLSKPKVSLIKKNLELQKIPKRNGAQNYNLQYEYQLVNKGKEVSAQLIAEIDGYKNFYLPILIRMSDFIELAKNKPQLIKGVTYNIGHLPGIEDFDFPVQVKISVVTPDQEVLVYQDYSFPKNRSHPNGITPKKRVI